MKKVLSVLAVLLIISTSSLNAEEKTADCFLEAFDSLDNHIHDLGFEPSLDYQIEYVNDAYAACDCIGNGNCYF